MKKVLAVVLFLLMCGTAQAEVQKLKSVRRTSSGAVKATPGVFYGISGRVTTAAAVTWVSDGATGDTDDIVFSQGAAVDEDRIFFFAPNGIDCSETGIWYWTTTPGLSDVVIYYQ